jgi:hypothetical protein
MGKRKKHLSIKSWHSDIFEKSLSFEHRPENEITPEMCFVAIQYWGAALQYVPDKYKTYELCLDAVRQNAWTLDDVSEKLREEVCGRFESGV